MREYRQLITAEYKKQHYPDGYFASLVTANNSTKARAGVWLDFIMRGVVMNIGFILCIFAFRARGFTIPFFVCMAIGLVQLLVLCLLLRSLKKIKNRTKEEWIAEAVGSSQCTESEIKEFEQQMMTLDSYFLALSGNVESQVKYILTDGYLLIGCNTSSRVIPIRNIIGACFTYCETLSFFLIDKPKPGKVLAVGLVTKDSDVRINTDKNPGTAFINMLKEKNPGIIISDDDALREKAYMAWVKELQKK